MKRIVISCDGTWNRADAKRQTNAQKLACAVEPADADGVAQILCQVDGVGTGRGTGRVSRTIDRALGGALGLGLMQNIADAYRFLAFNYSPGDEIFIFGYSRGAFTARSLVGLIRNCGVLRRDALHKLCDALRLYRSRKDHPDSGKSEAFRAKYAVEDRTPIAYIGVWDTVGSLGIPKHLVLASLFNRGLAFHDTDLSGCVRAARHAVAIDERRRTYEPTLWSNLDTRNEGRDGTPYRQIWFPGDHGGVGGGADSDLLSNDALFWVAEGAQEAGLALAAASVEDWASARNCGAPLPGEPDLFNRVVAFGFRDREGPKAPGALSEAAVKRWLILPSWRPGALGKVAHLLENRETSS